MLNYLRYFFGPYNIKDVSESWVGAEKSWVEVYGAEWRCIELDEGGCTV